MVTIISALGKLVPEIVGRDVVTVALFAGAVTLVVVVPDGFVEAEATGVGVGEAVPPPVPAVTVIVPVIFG